MKRIIIPTQIMERLVAEASDPAQEQTAPGHWPEPKPFSVLAEAAVQYGNQRLAGITTTSDQSDGSRSVLIMLANGDEEAHRVFNYLPETGEAAGSGSMKGPVTEAQMDADAALTSRILNLLLGNEGKLTPTPDEWQRLLNNSVEPTLYWTAKQQSQ